MDKTKDKPETAPVYDGAATVPLAYHEISINREKREKKWMIIGWAVSVVMAVALFVFLWLQYDYVSYSDNTGVYVVTDSSGNVIASDLAPEDVIRIMEELRDGKDTQGKGQG